MFHIYWHTGHKNLLSFPLKETHISFYIKAVGLSVSPASGRLDVQIPSRDRPKSLKTGSHRPNAKCLTIDESVTVFENDEFKRMSSVTVGVAR